MLLRLQREILAKIIGLLRIDLLHPGLASSLKNDFRNLLRYRFICNKIRLCIDSEKNRYTDLINALRAVNKLDIHGVLILKKHCLSLQYKVDRWFTIYLKTLTGKTIPLNVYFLGTVGQLKKKIETEEGIPFCHQQLIFSGKALEDDRLLRDYKICEGSTIHCFLGLRASWKS